jgi:hypothetical protein
MKFRFIDEDAVTAVAPRCLSFEDLQLLGAKEGDGSLPPSNMSWHRGRLAPIPCVHGASQHASRDFKAPFADVRICTTCDVWTSRDVTHVSGDCLTVDVVRPPSPIDTSMIMTQHPLDESCTFPHFAIGQHLLRPIGTPAADFDEHTVEAANATMRHVRARADLWWAADLQPRPFDELSSMLPSIAVVDVMTAVPMREGSSEPETTQCPVAAVRLPPLQPCGVSRLRAFSIPASVSLGPEQRDLVALVRSGALQLSEQTAFHLTIPQVREELSALFRDPRRGEPQSALVAAGCAMESYPMFPESLHLARLQRCPTRVLLPLPSPSCTGESWTVLCLHLKHTSLARTTTRLWLRDTMIPAFISQRSAVILSTAGHDATVPTIPIPYSLPTIKSRLRLTKPRAATEAIALNGSLNCACSASAWDDAVQGSAQRLFAADAHASFATSEMPVVVDIAATAAVHGDTVLVDSSLPQTVSWDPVDAAGAVLRRTFAAMRSPSSSNSASRLHSISNLCSMLDQGSIDVDVGVAKALRMLRSAATYAASVDDAMPPQPTTACARHPIDSDAGLSPVRKRNRSELSHAAAESPLLAVVSSTSSASVDVVVSAGDDMLIDPLCALAAVTKHVMDLLTDPAVAIIVSGFRPTLGLPADLSTPTTIAGYFAAAGIRSDNLQFPEPDHGPVSGWQRGQAVSEVFVFLEDPSSSHPDAFFVKVRSGVTTDASPLASTSTEFDALCGRNCPSISRHAIPTTSGGASPDAVDIWKTRVASAASFVMSFLASTMNGEVGNLVALLTALLEDAGAPAVLEAIRALQSSGALPFAIPPHVLGALQQMPPHPKNEALFNYLAAQAATTGSKAVLCVTESEAVKSALLRDARWIELCASMTSVAFAVETPDTAPGWLLSLAATSQTGASLALDVIPLDAETIAALFAPRSWRMLTSEWLRRCGVIALSALRQGTMTARVVSVLAVDGPISAEGDAPSWSPEPAHQSGGRPSTTVTIAQASPSIRSNSNESTPSFAASQPLDERYAVVIAVGTVLDQRRQLLRHVAELTNDALSILELPAAAVLAAPTFDQPILTNARAALHLPTLLFPDAHVAVVILDAQVTDPLWTQRGATFDAVAASAALASSFARVTAMHPLRVIFAVDAGAAAAQALLMRCYAMAAHRGVGKCSFTVEEYWNPRDCAQLIVSLAARCVGTTTAASASDLRRRSQSRPTPSVRLLEQHPDAPFPLTLPTRCGLADGIGRLLGMASPPPHTHHRDSSP